MVQMGRSCNWPVTSEISRKVCRSVQTNTIPLASSTTLSLLCPTSRQIQRAPRCTECCKCAGILGSSRLGNVELALASCSIVRRPHCQVPASARFSGVAPTCRHPGARARVACRSLLTIFADPHNLATKVNSVGAEFRVQLPINQL